MKRLAVAGSPMLFLIAVLMLWQVAPDILGLQPYMFPKLSTVVAEGWDYRSLVWINSRTTFLEALAGLAISFVIGTFFGLLFAFSTSFRRLFLPYVAGSNAIPIIAIAP